MLAFKGGVMTGKDIIIMSREELKRIHIIKQALEGKSSQVNAAKLLNLSDRQIRLKEIKSIEEANEFLDMYLPEYNRRFSLEPKRQVDMHRLLARSNLDRIFCIRKEHALRNDYTVAHDKKLYQVLQKNRGEKGNSRGTPKRLNSY